VFNPVELVIHGFSCGASKISLLEYEYQEDYRCKWAIACAESINLEIKDVELIKRVVGLK